MADNEAMDLSKEILQLVSKGSKGSKRKVFDSDDESESIFSDSSPSELDEYDEDLFKDEQDRRELDKLPEIEREAILYERSLQRQRKIEKMELKRRLSKSKGQREPSSEKTKKAESLKALQERRKKKSASSYYDESEEEEEGKISVDDDEDYSANEETVVEDSQEVDERTVSYEQAIHLQISRNRLMQWMYRPSFKELVEGYFVRVVFQSTREKCHYKFARIVGFHEKPVKYKVANQETNICLVVAQGNLKRRFTLAEISNSDVKKEEFESWKKVCQETGTPLITHSEAKEMIRVLSKRKNESISAEELQGMIDIKRQFGKGLRKLAVEKALLLRQKEDAEMNGDEEALDRINESLKEIAEKELEKKSSEKPDTFALLNEKNRLLNQHSIRRAEKQAGKKVVSEFDPFSRRKTKSTVIHSHNSGDELSEPKQEIVDLSAMDSSVDTKPKNVNFDDLMASIDLDIHVDISNGMKGIVILVDCKVTIPTPSNPSSADPKSKRLDFSSYKQLKGLI